MEVVDKFYAIIVLYHQSEIESKTLYSLNSSLNSLNKSLRTIIYDNSESKFVFDLKNAIKIYPNLEIEYLANKSNPGLSEAYNYALNKSLNARFLLLFDQDTTVTNDFLQEVLCNDSNYDCLVPNVTSKNNIQISPMWYNCYGGLEVITPNTINNKKGFVTAINSGAVYNVESLRRLGGFSNEFKLDMLDHYIFYMMNLKNYKILFLNASINQDLSIDNYTNIGFDRFKSIMESEVKLVRKFRFINIFLYRFRVAIRAIKFLLQRKFKFSFFLFKLIFHVRKDK